ncbi:type III secretion protein HrpB4 [Burkholderia ambifaria]|uniref:type III secretion protein HrpB4 n=1 Tax=Burkholderia ambifaria TaxID=152480 RepID=UPI0012FE6268|nr:type III secretion protein HrpB4 [Burkholderia ambifaria]
MNERLASALEVYQRNARTAAIWADASWFGACVSAAADGGDTAFSRLRATLSMRGEGPIAAVSLALLRLLEVEPVTLSGLVGPQWSSLDAVPVDVAMQVLRMRALMFRRMEVRRLIDRKSRVSVSEWSGMQIDLLESLHADAPDIALLARTMRIPPLRALDAHALSCEGLALLLRDLNAERPPFKLARLLFSRDLRLPEWPRHIDRALDDQGSVRLMERLPEWLPERGWVFG